MTRGPDDTVHPVRARRALRLAWRPRSIGMLGAAGVMVLPLLVPLAAPVDVARASNGNGGTSGLCLTADIGDADEGTDGLLVVGEEYDFAIQVTDEDEDDCPTQRDGVKFLPGVSFPTGTLSFEAELRAGFAADQLEPWADLWVDQPTGVTVGDAVAGQLEGDGSGALISGDLTLDNGGGITVAEFVSGLFVVSPTLAGLDLKITVRLFDDGTEIAEWDVEVLRVLGDLCLVAMLLPGDAYEQEGISLLDGAAQREVEPGGEVLLLMTALELSVDQRYEPAEERLCVDGRPWEHRIVTPVDTRAIDLFGLVAELSRSGHGTQSWRELMKSVKPTPIVSGAVGSVGFDDDGFDDDAFGVDDDGDGGGLPDDRIEAGVEPDDDGEGPAVDGEVVLVLLLELADDAQPGDYPIDLSMFAATFGTVAAAVRLVGDTGLLGLDLPVVGPETDPLRLTLVVPGGDDGGDTGAASTPPAAPDVEGSFECSAPAIGSGTSCALVAEPGRTFTWEASTNPVFATGQVTTGADGTAAFSFTVPDELLGQPIVVRVIGVAGAAGTIGVAGPPVPTAVPAGEGPTRMAGLLLLLGAAALGARLLVTAERRAVPARPR